MVEQENRMSGRARGTVAFLAVTVILFLFDAALEHAGGAALDELVVDDAVGGRPALHLPSFGLVHGENPVLQKF